ncbi:MAG: glutamine amidotransferase [Candidatus Nomurabacteria bacterium]|jgi:CobQ-like glutamine amidotransferase family enzyme|nr:glutamine amidotransferase [Candidatus Nomurabacteria bacterium]
MKKTLKIAMLYPREMNIYGDHGNLEVLTHRAKLYGFDVEQIIYEPDEKLPADVDIILGGGGQDSGQNKIVDDLIKIGSQLHKLAGNGVPMLMICGLYQLFGHYFLTKDDQKIAGIGIFDMVTKAGSERLISNIVTNWDDYKLVGYENHSGLTTLNNKQKPFAKVVAGAGNNGDDQTEGARIHNVFGSYLHGPILSKNPKFADELLMLAARRKFSDEFLKPRDESAKKQLVKIHEIAEQAREIAMKRPR